MSTPNWAKGNAAYSVGDYADSIRYFTGAIHINPTNHVLYSNRSAAYASLYRFSEALSNAQKTVKLKPDWAKGYLRLGVAHHGLNQYAEAIAAYKKGLEIDPNNESLKSGLEEASSALMAMQKDYELSSLNSVSADFLNEQTMEQEALQTFTLKVLVAKDENKVLFAESNKGFIDVLFSFMTMPIGATIRLTRENSTKGKIGCLNKFYESVENLDEDFLRSRMFRDVLLHPRGAADIYCRNLKLNLMGSDSNEYYVCRNGACKLLSYYQLGNCPCGEVFKHKLKLSNSNPISVSQEEGVFVKPTARFMISDDFQVMPMSTMTSLNLCGMHGADGKIEERTISVGRDEVLKLLECSLTSATPLSDTFLKPPILKSNYKCFHGNYGPRSGNPLQKVKASAKKWSDICFKLLVNKAKNRTLYAEVKEDFVNLICSFLAFPLNYIFNRFPCLSFKGCMGNLYKSIQDTEVNLFCSEEMKKILVEPKLAPGLAYNNQIIGIGEASTPSYPLSCLYNSKLMGLSSESHQGEGNIGEGLIKGPSMFMVMDNLEVKPLSPISGISFINKCQVPLCDIEEQEMTMGEDEALRLLVASLVSKHALTDTFLLKEPRIECWDFLQKIWWGMGKDQR